jgi:PAS domain S-box-containing protein
MDGESRDTKVTSSAGSDAALGRAVMDVVEDGVFQIDGGGCIVAVNDALLDETGFDRDALLGESMSALLADGDATEGRAVVEALLSGDGGDSETLDLTVATADGRLDAELHVRAVNNGDGVAGVVGTLREADGGQGGDRPGDDSYRRLLSHLPGMAYRCRNEPGWPMGYVSEGCAEVSGYDADRLASGEVSWGDDVIHPEDRDDVWRDVQAAVDDGGDFELTYRIETADGDTRWVWEQGRRVDGADGEVLEGFVVDVTERRRAQRQLERERDLVESIVESSPVGIGVVNPDGTIVRANEHAEEILGLSAGELADQPAAEHPVYDVDGDPIPADERPFAEALETGETVQNREIQVEKPDGERRWLSVNAVPLFDEDGDVERVIVTAEDVTERVEREEQLRRERDLVEGILETSPVSVVVVNRDGEVTKANSRAKRRLGVPEDGTYELGERPVYDEDGEFVPPDERPYRDVFETGDPVEGWRCQIETAAGDRRWASVNVAPMPGDEDRVVVAAEDVTDLKETQRALARERDELEAELSELFGRVTDAFFALDDDWEFTYLNERAKGLLDQSEADLLGKSVWEGFGETVGSPFQAEYERAMEHQEPVSFEEYYPALDAWFSVSAYPSESGLSVYFRDVTERKHRERQLEENERRYRTLAEQFPNGIVTLFDHDLEYTLAAGQAFDSLSVDPDEVKGRSVREAWGEEIADELEPLFEAALAGEKRSVERSYAGREWVVHVVPITDEQGDVFAGMTMALDITERKRFEDAIRTLHDTTQELFHAESGEEVADLVVTAASEVLGLSDSALYLHDDERGDLYPAAKATDVGVMWDDLPRVTTGDDTIVGHVYASGESARWDDIREAPQFIEEETSMRAGVYAPVGEHGAVFAGSSEVGAFDDRTLQLLELLAANAEAAFDRVERERSLEESEGRYRTLAEQFPNGAVGLYDDDLRYELVAGPMLPDLGLDADEMEGQTIHEVFPPETASQLESLFAGALDGETDSLELEFAGHVVQMWATPVRDDDGEVFAGLSFAQDVTERVERERAIRESERRYRTLAEQFPNGIVTMYDHDLRYTVAGGEVFERFEFSADEMEGSTVHDLFDGDLAETLAEEYRAALDGEQREFDLTYAGREWHAHAVPLRDEDGEVFAGLVMSQDITERKQRERELERYETIVETVDDGICTLDSDCRFTMVNDAFADILAVDRDEVVGTQVPGLIPEDSTASAADLREALVESENDDIFEIEIVNEAGEELVLDLRASVLDDGDGLESIIGVVRDVTRRKERERELERALDLLERTERIADVGGWEINPETMDVFWTDQTFELLEVSGDEEPPLEEALDMYHEADQSIVEDAVEDAMESGNSFDVEARVRTAASDEVRWLRLQGVPETVDGEVVSFRGAAQDVTERKRRERELEQYHTVMQTASDAIVTVDESNVIRSANSAVEEIFGYEPDEVVGEQLTTLMPERMADIHLDAFHEYLGSGNRTLEWDYLELPGRHKDGGEVPLGVSFSEYEHDDERFFAGVIRDITDRKERERELERYEILVETIWDGVYALDDESNFVMVNDAFCELVGWEREDLLGEPADVVHTGNIDETAARMAESVLAGERDTAVLEHELRTMGGGTVPVETRFGPYPYDDDSYGRCGVARDVSERLARERELRARMRQQQVTAELGRLALEEPDLDRLFEETAGWVAATLGTEVCDVLDYDESAGELWMRQSVGWEDDDFDDYAVDVDDGSQAIYTLRDGGPVVVDDLASETRFEPPEPLLDHGIQSGMSVVIGSENEPWGLLGTHDTEHREFSEHDVSFLESVANVLAAAVARNRRVREIERQRQHLAALDNLNRVVQDINEALAESSTRQEIERSVCERLVEAEDYALAWIGEVDRNTREVTPGVWAGDGEEYIDAIDVTVDDSETSRGPTGRAVETMEMQTTADFAEEEMRPWRDAAREHGFESSAAVPLVYESALYGVLNVYATRPAAFEGREGDVLSQLGGVVGHAIRSVERKEALMSEHVVELEFRSREVAAPFRAHLSDDAEIRFERTISTDEEGKFLQYVIVEGMTEAEFRAALDDTESVTSERLLSERGDELVFELATAGPPITSRIASHGGRVREAGLADGEFRVVAEIPHSVEVRSMVSSLSEVASDLELVSQRSTQRDDSLPEGRSAMESLTDKQLAAVEAAFYAGYFDWPRESTAEELAESMGVSAPTLHQHLRKGERKLLAGYFGD